MMSPSIPCYKKTTNESLRFRTWVVSDDLTCLTLPNVGILIVKTKRNMSSLDKNKINQSINNWNVNK